MHQPPQGMACQHGVALANKDTEVCCTSIYYYTVCSYLYTEYFQIALPIIDTQCKISLVSVSY